jgi:hypothetical protein
MTNLARSIVPRFALTAMALLPVCGAVKCFQTGAELDRDFDRSHPDRRMVGRGPSSGSFLPYSLGSVLCLVAAPFALASVAPASVFSRWVGAPRATLWQNETPDEMPISHGRSPF